MAPSPLPGLPAVDTPSSIDLARLAKPGPVSRESSSIAFAEFCWRISVPPVFGAAGANLSIFQQPRPIETFSREGGWDADAIIAKFLPRIEKLVTPLDETAIRANARPPTAVNG